MTKNHSKFSITLITLITFFKNLNHHKKRNHSNHRNTVILVMVLPALVFCMILHSGDISASKIDKFNLNTVANMKSRITINQK